ncbi:MAG: hypothetical protein WC712_07245 [Candidatus Brocadiia bacterium]
MKYHRLLVLSLAIALLLVLAPATAEKSASSNGWEPLGLSGGGAMFCPAVSPVNGKNMLVHCDMSAAYYSHDGGRNWRMIHHSQLSSNTKVTPCWHPTEADTVFSAGGWGSDTIKVSRDGGETWDKLGTLPASLEGAIAIDPGNPMAMLTGAGGRVYLSNNGGKSWRQCNGPDGTAVGFFFDVASPTQSRVLFAATDKGIWKSSDGGLSWVPKTAGLGGKQIVSFSGGANEKDKTCVLYCTIPSSADTGAFTGGVYRSPDRGEKWESAMGEGINVDTKSFDQWSVGSVPQYRWVLTTNAKPKTVYAFNSNTAIAPPHHATAFRSDDAGKTWRATFYPDPRYQNCNFEKPYVVSEDGQFYQSVPNGVAINAANPDQVFFVTDGELIITDDGGKSWFPGHTRLAPGQNASGKGLNWICTGLVVTTTWNYYIDPFERNRHYICYTDIGFARSLDGGKTWRWWSEQGRAPWRNTCYELALDPKEKGRIWGAFSNVHDIPNANIMMNRHKSTGEGGICVSDDFGETWKPLAGGLPKAPATCIVLDPKSAPDKRTLYAGFFGGGVFKSTDGGASWIAKNTKLGAPDNMRVSKLLLHADGMLFAVVTGLVSGREFSKSGVGLYRSKNGGDSWEFISQGQDFLWPKDITVDPKDSRHVYLSNADANGKQSGGLYMTSDGGATWTRLCRLASEHFGCYLDPKRPDVMYATLTEDAPNEGIWRSSDGGRTFAPIKGMPFRNVMRVTFDPKDGKLLYLTTFGGSVWRGRAE